MRDPKRLAKFVAALGCASACRTYVFAMRKVRACLAVGCLLPLSGCATIPDAGSQFDGTYVGTSTVTRGGNEWCRSNIAADSLTISAGRFSYPFPIITPTPVVVQPRLRADGSFSGGAEYFEAEPGLFHGPLAQVSMVGHIAGATLDAQVESLTCGRHLSFTRR
jgi:uncharacterized protein YceK